MNSKGAEYLLPVFALFILALIALTFFLTINPNFFVGKSAITELEVKGQLRPSVFQESILQTYLRMPVNTCSLDEAKLLPADYTYQDLLAYWLSLSTNPITQASPSLLGRVDPLAELWLECTAEHFEPTYGESSLENNFYSFNLAVLQESEVLLELDSTPNVWHYQANASLFVPEKGKTRVFLHKRGVFS